jgi:hypothetical protein
VNEPEQEIVREIAQQVANIALHDAVHVDQWIGAVISDKLGNECSQVKVKYHTAVARWMAVVKPSWPDEQQPAETTGGEQVQDGVVGRPLIERLSPEDAERVGALIDERDCWRKEVLDLRAVLAERNALAARVAELEGEGEADARAVAEVAAAEDDELLDHAISNLIARFADRIEAMDATALARAESATVLPERWRALIAERDEARELARVSLDILRNVSDEPMRELFEVDDMDELPDWFTGYGKPSAVEEPR